MPPGTMDLLTPTPSWPPPPREKKPGLAFLLSLLLPGLGQFYCGKIKRGVWTLVFSLLSGAGVVFLLASLESGSNEADILWGTVFRAFLVLYAFAFLDAYFTASEISAGIDPHVVENPRVAAVLNLLTRGFGYWYVGDRKKGVIIFFLLGGVSRAAAKVDDLQTTTLLFLLVEVALVVMAFDAYRIARRQLEERLEVLPTTDTPMKPAPGFGPAAPVGLAGVLVLGYIALATVGLIMPDYSVIDQSRAVYRDSDGAKSYSNPRYGIEMQIPQRWEFDTSDPTYFAQGVFLDGACQVDLMAQESLPFFSLDSLADDLADQLLIEYPNFRFEASNGVTLSGQPARDVVMVADVDGTEVRQHYYLMRTGLTLYALVTTMVAGFEDVCLSDLEFIRERLTISK